MNPQAEPFSDVRVRQAFKLAVDRERIVENVYFGRAFVGNDVPGLGFPNYDTELEQRAHDPEKAKELLAEAGAEGIEVELTAGPEMPGMLETATLIVEDLKAVGVKATLKELPAGQLFADYPAYQKLPFKAGYNPPATFEPNHVPGAFPEVDALVAEARSATSPEARLQASHEAQKLLWEEATRSARSSCPASAPPATESAACESCSSPTSPRQPSPNEPAPVDRGEGRHRCGDSHCALRPGVLGHRGPAR